MNSIEVVAGYTLAGRGGSVPAHVCERTALAHAGSTVPGLGSRADADRSVPGLSGGTYDAGSAGEMGFWGTLALESDNVDYLI